MLSLNTREFACKLQSYRGVHKRQLKTSATQRLNTTCPWGKNSGPPKMPLCRPPRPPVWLIVLMIALSVAIGVQARTGTQCTDKQRGIPHEGLNWDSPCRRSGQLRRPLLSQAYVAAISIVARTVESMPARLRGGCGHRRAVSLAPTAGLRFLLRALQVMDSAEQRAGISDPDRRPEAFFRQEYRQLRESWAFRLLVAPVMLGAVARELGAITADGIAHLSKMVANAAASAVCCVWCAVCDKN